MKEFKNWTNHTKIASIFALQMELPARPRGVTIRMTAIGYLQHSENLKVSEILLALSISFIISGQKY